MSAPERKAKPENEAASAPCGPSGLSMSELLQSCAAADAVSTPPAADAEQDGDDRQQNPPGRRKAA